MATYDSAKTRKAAREISRLVESLEGEVTPEIRSASEPQQIFRGKAARAMEEKCLALLKMADRIGEDMMKLSRQIEAYAETLEEMDRQLAEKL